MDEKTARNILLLELKGRKKKREDPLKIAEACECLVDHGWSSEKIGKKFGVSSRMIGKFLSLTRLPPEVKQWVSNREIGIDVGAQLSEAKLDDETKVKVGGLIRGMLAHDARNLVRFATKFPNASVEEYKQRILTSKPQKEEVSLVVISLQEEAYRKLKEESEKRKISLHELGERIIEDWLKKSMKMEVDS